MAAPCRACEFGRERRGWPAKPRRSVIAPALPGIETRHISASARASRFRLQTLTHCPLPSAVVALHLLCCLPPCRRLGHRWAEQSSHQSELLSCGGGGASRTTSLAISCMRARSASAITNAPPRLGPPDSGVRVGGCTSVWYTPRHEPRGVKGTGRGLPARHSVKPDH